MDEDEKYMETIKILVETHNDEGNLIWIRFGHFIIITGSLLLAFSSIPNITKGTRYGICLIGILLSILWYSMTSRSWQWYKYWFDRIKFYQEKLLLEIFPIRREIIEGYRIKKSLFITYVLMIVVWIFLAFMTCMTNNFK